MCELLADEALTPNINEVVEFAIVVETDDSHINPKNVEEVWNHKNYYERAMKRNAIRKKFNDLFKHKL